MAELYITLVSSLPYLPPYERAERSPITRLRLDQRLSTLKSGDALQLAKAEAVASWRMSPAKPKTDKEMVLRCHAAMREISQPALREFIEFRIDQQVILAGLRQLKRGKVGRVVSVPSVTAIREATGLSQARFALLLGVSVRTLQEWEQGRRAPSGAARTLLLIAMKNPRALLEVA